MKRNIYHTAICTLFGHRPGSPEFDSEQKTVQSCRCGLSILHEDQTETRIRHVPGCFLFGHSCLKLSNRSGHYEFVCGLCGHPLLFEMERTYYSDLKSLRKKQRYLCSIFGHRVHKVVERDGFIEHSCGCGHSFLKSQSDMIKVKHPVICLLTGHFVSFVTRRSDYAEYVCRNCGHTFYFPSA